MSTSDRATTCTLLEDVRCPNCECGGLIVGGGKEWCQSQCGYEAPERRESRIEDAHRRFLARERERKSLRAIATLRRQGHDRPR